MRSAHPLQGRARGISLVLTLIALMVLMIGSVAMVRSFGTSTQLSGNLAFRRDLTNQAERAVVQARRLFLSGSLASEAARSANLPAANYSAMKLAADENGLPLVLLKDSAFAAAGMTGANDIADDTTGVRVRYVIDRQCGAPGAFDESACAAVQDEGDPGGSPQIRKPRGESRPVYRVTVRVDGPRSTQAFLQTTFSY